MTEEIDTDKSIEVLSKAKYVTDRRNDITMAMIIDDVKKMNYRADGVTNYKNTARQKDRKQEIFIEEWIRSGLQQERNVIPRRTHGRSREWRMFENTELTSYQARGYKAFARHGLALKIHVDDTKRWGRDEWTDQSEKNTRRTIFEKLFRTNRTKDTEIRTQL